MMPSISIKNINTMFLELFLISVIKEIISLMKMQELNYAKL